MTRWKQGTSDCFLSCWLCLEYLTLQPSICKITYLLTFRKVWNVYVKCWSTVFFCFFWMNVEYGGFIEDHLLLVTSLIRFVSIWCSYSILFIMSVQYEYRSFQFLLQNIYIIDSCFQMYSKPSITIEFNHSSRLVWVKDGPVVCKTCQGSNVKCLGSWSENPVNQGVGGTW